jgi:predicted amidophosphoribosyltransferase
MAAAQSSKSVEEVWAHAAMAEEDKKLDTKNWRENIRATCPECEAPLQTNAKFCPECGAQLKVSNECSGCGIKLSPGTKFCPECGQKV